MSALTLSFAPFPGSPPHDQINQLGNIADDVWKDVLAVTTAKVVNGRYLGRMEILL